jgi:hypothetical protein
LQSRRDNNKDVPPEEAVSRFDKDSPSETAGVVGETFRVFVIGRSQQQHAEDNAPRATTMMSAV